MKTVMVIIGIVVGIFASITMFQMFFEESGAGLFGAITGYVLIMAGCVWLVYRGTLEKQTVTVSNHKIQNEGDVYDDRITSLKDLKNSGILTEEEYRQKSKNIENSKLEAQLKESSNYKKLKSLFDDGVLTKEEFENKVEILKKSLKNTDYKLHKVSEDWSINLGKYIEYKITFKNGGEYNNVYQKVSESGYSIKRNDEILFFETIEDLLIFIKK